MTKLDQRPLLLCFSHLRWGFVWQRPQHLLSRAALSYRVLFVEEAYQGAEVDEPYLYRTFGEAGVEIIVPHLPVAYDARTSAAALTRMIDHLLLDLGEDPSVIWYYTPTALAFSRHLDADLFVFDCMDQLSAFKDAPKDLVAFEAEMFRRADLVLCGGRTLFEDKRRRHANIHLFPSSIDAGHFARARLIVRQRPAHERPTLGFFGVIDERLDLALVEAMARLRPDWRFEMIGPVTKIDSASLPRRDNLAWLGGVDYADLPERLATWDVGVMPFALNEATRFISPTKTPEFLAAGLPVISTPIADVVTPYGDAGLVEIARTPDRFIAAAERLLARERKPWLSDVDAFLSATSWDRTWSAIHALMRAGLRREVSTLVRA